MPESKIEKLPIKSLTLLERNPRKITNEQMEKLERSLLSDPDFLWKRPILVNKEGDKLIVYGGNQRVLAAKKLKWSEIPCIIDENLDEKTIKDRIIKDNKNYGTFDFDILGNEFEIHDLIEAGFLEEELIGSKIDIIEPENLTEEENVKNPTMKITFKRVEDLQKAENKIAEIVNRFEGAYYSISAGEL